MKKKIVGSDQKPTAEQLLAMGKLDNQMKEIRRSISVGLNDRHVQALIEHRNLP